MDIDLLRAFCELAVKGNYGAAADKLFMTQSALTKKIQRLENSIGCSLFTRSRTGTKLTQVGKTLFPEAKRLVARFNEFELLCSHVIDGTVGYLKIGYGISSYKLAPECIAAFKTKCPNIHVTLNDIPSYKQFDLLRQDELQLSFNRLPVSLPLKGIRVMSDNLVIAVHNLVEIDEDNIFESLTNIDYMRLNPKRGPGVSSLIERYCIQSGTILNPAREANDILTLLSMVSSNLGYTVLPASSSCLGHHQIRYLPLPSVDTSWDVGVIWNDSTADPLRDQFIQFAVSFI
ncbi:LysR family transcriptional regulator [Xenorhabdus sp. TH1]|uniref:LysR family transcriptional regulator n=1 Tax=Xenorhabdus sp. TH1 TaxID=3130166 RepID=UPI0030CB8F52